MAFAGIASTLPMFLDVLPIFSELTAASPPAGALEVAIFRVVELAPAVRTGAALTGATRTGAALAGATRTGAALKGATSTEGLLATAA
jgi:uncharacterized protein YjbI with pentapeptide repeats